MIPTIIRHKLAVLRQRERLLLLVWGVARLLAVVLGLIVLACLIDFIVDRFVETPYALHVALLMTLAASAIVGTLYFFWPLTKRLSDDELSLWIEDKTPTMQHRLISAVQFNETGAEFTGMSTELVGVVTREAEEHVRRVPVARIADHGRLKRSGLALGSAVVVAGIPLLIWPALCGILLSRLILDDVAIPRRVNSVESVTSPVHPKGENIIVKVKAYGAVPGDKAILEYRQGGVTDSANMEIDKATLHCKLDYLAQKSAAFAAGMAETRLEFARAQTQIGQSKSNVEQLEETLRKTTDPDKQRPLVDDIDKLKDQLDKLAARHDKLGVELKTARVKEQEALMAEVEEHARELNQFHDEEQARNKDDKRNADLALAVKKLDLAAAQLDQSNDAAGLAAAHEYLLAALALMNNSPVHLIEGDVLSIQLPLSKGDSHWVVSEDSVLVPEGKPEVRTNELGQGTFTQSFQAVSAGRGSLQFTLKKEGGSSGTKPVKFAAEVADREVLIYRAAVKAPSSTRIFTFRAYVGDGRMRSDATVAFEPRPVADLTAFAVLPPYCQAAPDGLPYQIYFSSGEVRGIPGSSVSIKATVLREIKSAKLNVFEIEDPSSDDAWKRRERRIKSIPMELFLKDRTVEVKAFRVPGFAGTMFFSAKGEPVDNASFFDAKGNLDENSLSEAGFKPDAEVNFVVAPTGMLLKMRLLDSESKPSVVDGPHMGKITKIDADKKLLTVERTEGPTYAQAEFELPHMPKETKYSVEIEDIHGFKNDPIPKFGAKEIVETRPIVKLLPEEIPDYKTIYERMAKKSTLENDKWGVFSDLPVLVGGSMPIAYYFTSDYGIDRALLKFRIVKKTLGGNEGTNSNNLGLALDDADGAAKIGDILPRSPAEDAKLEIDDLITHVDGTAVGNVENFLKIVGARAAGDELTLTVKRKAKTMTVPIKIAAVAEDSFRPIPLVPYKNDGRKGDFDVDRGKFDRTGPKESVFFYARPSDDPYTKIGKLDGGGRFLLDIKTLGGGAGPQDGDEIEYYIEVYPASNPKVPRNNDRPFGRTETRRKAVSTFKALDERLMAIMQQVETLEADQRRVFETAAPPKNDEKKKR